MASKRFPSSKDDNASEVPTASKTGMRPLLLKRTGVSAWGPAATPPLGLPQCLSAFMSATGGIKTPTSHPSCNCFPREQHSLQTLHELGDEWVAGVQESGRADWPFLPGSGKQRQQRPMSKEWVILLIRGREGSPPRGGDFPGTRRLCHQLGGNVFLGQSEIFPSSPLSPFFPFLPNIGSSTSTTGQEPFC